MKSHSWLIARPERWQVIKQLRSCTFDPTPRRYVLLEGELRNLTRHTVEVLGRRAPLELERLLAFGKLIYVEAQHL